MWHESRPRSYPFVSLIAFTGPPIKRIVGRSSCDNSAYFLLRCAHFPQLLLNRFVKVEDKSNQIDKKVGGSRGAILCYAGCSGIC